MTDSELIERHWTQDHYVTRNSTTDDPSGYRVWMTCTCGWDSGTLSDGSLPTTHRAELEHYVAVFREHTAPTVAVKPAIDEVRRYVEGLEDWEAQPHVVEELLSALDDIPDCETWTAAPHSEHTAPTDDERAKLVTTILDAMDPGGYLWLAEKMADAILAEFRLVPRGPKETT